MKMVDRNLIAKRKKERNYITSLVSTMYPRSSKVPHIQRKHPDQQTVVLALQLCGVTRVSSQKSCQEAPANVQPHVVVAFEPRIALSISAGEAVVEQNVSVSPRG
jgi:hypothetical protein